MITIDSRVQVVPNFFSLLFSQTARQYKNQPGIITKRRFDPRSNTVFYRVEFEDKNLRAGFFSKDQLRSANKPSKQFIQKP